MAPAEGTCSSQLLGAAQRLAVLTLGREDGNLTYAAKEVLHALGLETSTTTQLPKTLAGPTQPIKETRNEYGALMYIIFVMVLFAAPMIALIVRYLWGERESSRMEAFYSRIMENKPPRMILYDYNGRRLTKPELQRPNPGRKLTYHGIPYQEGYYNPSSYCYRATPLPGDDPNTFRAGGKPPTIYLSEHKWRRWFGALNLAGTPDSPDSKYPFPQATSPCSPDIYLTPSTPHSESTSSIPFPLRPIALWRNRSGSDTSETQPSVRFLSRIRSFRRENSSKFMQEETQTASENQNSAYKPEGVCGQIQSGESQNNETQSFDETDQKIPHNSYAPQRKRAIVPGSARRQLQQPNRLLESNIDFCPSSSFPGYYRERHDSCTLPSQCGERNHAANLGRLSLPSISLQEQNFSHISNTPTLNATEEQKSSTSLTGRRTRKASDL